MGKGPVRLASETNSFAEFFALLLVALLKLLLELSATVLDNHLHQVAQLLVLSYLVIVVSAANEEIAS